MPQGQELLKKQPKFTILFVGPFSSGKTRNALTFPKVYAISCDPAGLDIVFEKENQSIANNLVWYEILRNSSEDNLKEIWNEAAKADNNQSIFGCLKHAKELAEKGAIETLLIDGFTYLVDMRWQYINEYEEARSNRTGNIDQQAMYRNLGLFLQRFVPSELLTFSTRNNCNVILTAHIKRESKDIVEGSDKLRQVAKKVSTESDIAPMIEGSYRNKIEGLFGAHIYLDNRIGPDGKPKYLAYCEKTIGFGTVVLAGNNYGLPAILDISGKSFYEVLSQNINKAVTA